MERVISFDGVSSQQLGLIIDGYFSRGIPQRRVTTREIPGHNGSFLVDEGVYDNIPQTYQAYWISAPSPQENASIFHSIANWLKQDGYYWLEDSDYPGVFRMAVASGVQQEDVINYRDCFCGIPLYFNCKPQVYLLEGDQEILVNSGSVLLNPTLEIAEPMILFHLNGTGTISINGYNNEFSEFTGDVVMDCERQLCYSYLTNLSNYMTGEFPVLRPGENTISFTGDISNFRIKPRWWTK